MGEPLIWRAAVYFFITPLSWMPGGGPGFCGSVETCRDFSSSLCTMADFVRFGWARRIFAKKRALFLARLVTAANPYSPGLVYHAQAILRQLACALAHVARLTTSAALRRGGESPAVVAASMGFFAVGVSRRCGYRTHLPRGGKLHVALIFAWAVFEKKSLRPLWRGAGDWRWVLDWLSFIFYCPRLEQPWVNISQALSSGLQPADNVSTPRSAIRNTTRSIGSRRAWAVSAPGDDGIAAIAAAPSIGSANRMEDLAKKLWRVLLAACGRRCGELMISP